MPQTPPNDPAGQPTIVGPQADSAIDQLLKETLVAGPKVSTPDGVTRVGTSDEMDSFSDYDVSDPAPLAPRLTNIGDYQIAKILGKGGMGVVYRARHLTLKRESRSK